MRTAVDSSVLLCILRRQTGWKEWQATLTRAAEEGGLVLCPVVFAECSMGFAEVKEARIQFDSLCIVYDAFSPRALSSLAKFSSATDAKADRVSISSRIFSLRPTPAHRPTASPQSTAATSAPTSQRCPCSCPLLERADLKGIWPRHFAFSYLPFPAASFLKTL